MFNIFDPVSFFKEKLDKQIKTFIDKVETDLAELRAAWEKQGDSEEKIKTRFELMDLYMANKLSLDELKKKITETL